MAKQIEILTFHPSDDIDLSSLALELVPPLALFPIPISSTKTNPYFSLA